MRASPPERRTGPDRPKTAPPFDSAGLLAEAAGNTPMKRSALFVTLALLAAAGCAKKEAPAHDHGPGHAHTAPHGGVLVELGDHAAALELRFDAARGVLQAWVLDGHAENFVRIAQPRFEVEARSGETGRLLDFVAALERALGVQARRELLPMQPGDVRSTEASMAALEAWVGFRPLTGLDEGIARFAEWFTRYRAGAGASA